MLRGETIVVAGATGQVGFPVAMALAAENDVVAAARFKDADARAALEKAGARCIQIDMVKGEFSSLPSDPAYVLNFAVVKTNKWDRDIAGNAEAVGLLMAQCRGARAFLHCSSTGVYQPVAGEHRYKETDELGDNHRVSPWLQTYSITKIAGEAVARTTARMLGVPTTVARLNVPYGDNGGWPAIQLDMALGGMAVDVAPGSDSFYNPIHEDDVVAHIPRLLEIAAVPAVTVNWGGDDVVSVQEWCAYLTELTGVDIPLAPSEQAIPGVSIDLARQHELVGHSTVGWRDGMRRMIAARHPELLRGSAG